MKQIGTRGPGVKEWTAAAIAWDVCLQGTKQAMWTVEPCKALLRVGSGQSMEDFAAVYSYAGELWSGAIRGIQCNRQASLL